MERVDRLIILGLISLVICLLAGLIWALSADERKQTIQETSETAAAIAVSVAAAAQSANPKTEEVTQFCVGGVLYYEFPKGGVSVAYDSRGTLILKRCEEGKS